MKLLFISKRRPQGRDLFTQPYGRFHYLPLELARRGHQVQVQLFSYDAAPSMRQDWADQCTVHTRGLFNQLHRASRDDDHAPPDWIIGCSDVWCHVLAIHWARRWQCRTVLDAYDHLAAYYPRVPGIQFAWQWALTRATQLTAAGPQLAELMRHYAGNDRPVTVLPMAADPLFYPRDRDQCRQQLGLPLDIPLLGYLGALDGQRQVNQLFATYRAVKQTHPAAQLILSGRLNTKIPLPPATRYVGYLPPAHVPLLLNSLDVAFVINRATAFGDYAYPVKLYEAMRCHIPVVATAVGGTAWILRHHRQLLIPPDDSAAWLDATQHALTLGRYHYDDDPAVATPQWRDIALQLEQLLHR